MQMFGGSSAGPPGRFLPEGSQFSEFSNQKGSRSCSEEEEDREVSSSLLEESQETHLKATKWTDEKHSLYLKSMEASFVDELYNSLDSLNCRPNEEGSLELKGFCRKDNGKGTPTPSGQFKVFRDGSWARINFRRETTQAKKVEGPGNILVNPWVQHYKSSRRHGTRISAAFKGQLDRQDSAGSNAEMTDQNFVEDDSEEEQASRTLSNKCRKISKATSSGNDQVVPFGKSSLIGGDVAEGHGSSKE